MGWAPNYKGTALIMQTDNSSFFHYVCPICLRNFVFLTFIFICSFSKIVDKIGTVLFKSCSFFTIMAFLSRNLVLCIGLLFILISLMFCFFF